MGCPHHIFPLPLRSALPSEGEEVFIYTYLSSGSLRSPEVKHDSPPSATLHKQSILCLLSYDAQRLYALWIPNLNPVGFCVVCAFCGNYKQRRYKYKSLSPINCNLHFCHSIFRMNLFLCLYTSIAEAPTKLKTKQ